MEKNKIQTYLAYAKKAVLEAGKLVETKKIAGYRVIRKDVKELVTEVDMVVQAQLIDYLSSKTDCHLFISEEKSVLEVGSNDCWIIDPLDGTHNFIAGLPFYSISVAYLGNNEIILGVIYFPQSGDLYCVQKGHGAFKNNCRINVSINDDIEKSIVAYDNQFYLAQESIANFVKIQEKTFTVRILGVASRDACYVAEGILDARIWNSTKLCDIAAGTLIVKEAGGKATDFSGNEINLQSVKDVIVSNGRFHNEIVDILNGGENGV
ncbi:Fructose-1,6-bisphosphatase/inositol-1-monophosphatase [subsurface metagenome]